MNGWRFILSSLRHYRRIHLAVALGVAVATAVLTGALLVGDSVRGSLKDLSLQRLGHIDSAVVSPHMFRAKLAQEIVDDSGFRKYFATAEPAILLNGTLQSGSGRNERRATSVSVIGSEESFWSLGEGGPAMPLAAGEVAITQSLSDELDAKAGDSVLLRIPSAVALPADSPLGAKQAEKTRSGRMKVAAVLPPVGLARFGLVPSQQLPRNVFVPLATLQRLLEKPGKANAIFVSAAKQDSVAGDAAQKALQVALRPKLDDLGLRVEAIGSPANVVLISSDQLVLPDAVVRAVDEAFPGGKLQPIVTYLANTIVGGEPGSERKIPYSTITGVDSLAGIGPLLEAEGKPITLADNEIVLNRWAAGDLKARIGDNITVTFYEPESTHGRLREHQPPPVFKLRAIAALKTKDGKPTAAVDPKLTPEMPGVTDQKSISDWDLPFELVEKIRRQDETYWDEYRTTPKAFISLTAAKRMWASRWGTISLIRVPVDAAAPLVGDKGIAERLRREVDPAALGMAVLPLKQLGLEAAAGTTPFGGLFLGFSFFLIAAAVMLIAILFQLGIQQRATELGTLAAIGIERRRISRLLTGEGVLVAAIGATVGTGAGVLYAWLVIFGLRTWWIAAISTPFIELHVAWPSLLIGWLVGVIVSWLAIWWSIRKLVRTPAARLLGGSGGVEGQPAVDLAWRPTLWGRIARLIRWTMMRVALVALAIAFCVFGFFLQGEAQAGVFFGSGAAVLLLLLGEIRHRLRSFRDRSHDGFSLMRLSALNTARNPGRSTLTIGLVAAASFLIVAVSAFRLDTGEAGTGGFQFMATSDQPIHFDLNTTEGRRELGFSDEASRQLDGWRIYSLRVAAGEDASCLNLYQPKQPRVLGIPKAFIKRGGFAWSATAAGFADKPWAALDVDLGQDSQERKIVPAVLDMSTAVYSLHLDGVGSRLTIRDGAGRNVTVQVVGLLENSVLQGNVLVSEANFLRLFPDTGGYRFFLIEQVHKQREGEAPAEPEHRKVNGSAGASPSRELPQVLESGLAEEAFDVTDAREQLTQFLAVQNTYLSTFQSLGALGLLLGTIGLAVVQLRSVLERRGELALMRAGGFGRGRLTWMVVWENAVLLVGGLAIGCVAAAIALIPHWTPHGASIPWLVLGILLATIGVIGLAAGWLATRSALRAPILPALRGD